MAETNENTDNVARIALAIQRAGGDHLGDVDSVHRSFLAILADHETKVSTAQSELLEMEGIALEQHAILVDGLKWPPPGKSQLCGWCVQAAGDDKAARDAAPRYTLDEFRAHARVCPHNPVVQERDAARAEVARLRAEADVVDRIHDPASGVLVPQTTEEWSTVIDRAGLTTVVAPPGSPAARLTYAMRAAQPGTPEQLAVDQAARDERAAVVAHLRAVAARYTNPVLGAALRDAAAEIAAFEHLGGPPAAGTELALRLPPGLMGWLDHGARGASSKAIVQHLTGLPLEPAYRLAHCYPHDTSDLGRCRALLAAVPALRPRLVEMSALGQRWAVLVEHWEQLCAMADEDEDRACRRMRELLDRAGAS